MWPFPKSAVPNVVQGTLGPRLKRDKNKSPRIGILSYADTRNFGDELFPLVVSREISARIPSADITFLTSTGTSWAGMQSLRLDSVEPKSFDALILGGGEVVHRADEMLRGIYNLFELDCIERPTDIVFGWN